MTMLESVRLSSIGAVCAIATAFCFVLGAVAMGTSGVDVLIPDTGQQGLSWITDVDGANWLFFAGAWLIVLMGVLAIVAFVAFYDVLRGAGQVLLVAPVLGVVGLTLVTISHLVPIALADQLVPAYSDAAPATQTSLVGVFETFASIAGVTNAAGNFLGWGLALPLYSLAILTTRVLPRWIGWLGLVVAGLAGWLGLLSPLSDVISSISFLGFIGFFVFMVSAGVGLLRRRTTTSASM
jgi:hypothetical protein